jgi:hypothetical protein
MKNHRAVLFVLIVLTLGLAGCRARTDRSEGTVLLTISRFDGLPTIVSVGALGASPAPVTIDEIVIRNIPKDSTGTTSDLQSVELRSYEVRFRRRDTGTRVPPPTVQGIFGLVPVNGTTTLNNLPFLLSDQILSPPLRDLRDFGRDQETGTTVIVLDVTIRFFGRTLSGDEVSTEPATFTIEVRP